MTDIKIVLVGDDVGVLDSGLDQRLYIASAAGDAATVDLTDQVLDGLIDWLSEVREARRSETADRPADRPTRRRARVGSRLGRAVGSVSGWSAMSSFWDSWSVRVRAVVMVAAVGIVALTWLVVR